MQSCYSDRSAAGGNFSAVVWGSVSDLPARPVDPTHHAPHGVPPEDGDTQVLAGAMVFHHLVIVISPLLEERQPTVQCPQVPPHGWVGHHDHPLRPASATGRRLPVSKVALLSVVSQQRGERFLFEGAVLALPDGQTGPAALEEQGGGEDDGYDGRSHGGGQQVGSWLQTFALGSLLLLELQTKDARIYTVFRTGPTTSAPFPIKASPVESRKLAKGH